MELAKRLVVDQRQAEELSEETDEGKEFHVGLDEGRQNAGGNAEDFGNLDGDGKLAGEAGAFAELRAVGGAPLVAAVSYYAKPHRSSRGYSVHLDCENIFDCENVQVPMVGGAPVLLTLTQQHQNPTPGPQPGRQQLQPAGDPAASIAAGDEEGHISLEAAHQGHEGNAPLMRKLI